MNKYNKKQKKKQEVISFIINNQTNYMADRIKNCGGYLFMIANEDLSQKRIYKSNFCGYRFCPMCRWRQAKKDALKIAVMMEYIKDKYKKNFIFLTLTAPNVEGGKLKNEIMKYNKAFNRLMGRKEIEKVIKGYVRKLEVTYNSEKNTYHPHFHVLIAVNRSYFSGKSYICQSRWLELWQEAMKDNSITQVDVRRYKGDDVMEIATYASKDDDLYYNQDVYNTFYNALKSRQILTYNGLFKDANKLYKTNKPPYCVNEINPYMPVDENTYVYWLLYQWGLGEYIEVEKRELTEEEKRRVNKQLVEEIAEEFELEGSDL